MRLIDADKLPVKHGVNVGANYGGLRAIIFKRDIDNAPTVDAVEVVRCKDCKCWDNRTGECHNEWWGDGYGNYPPPTKRMDGEGYCDWAERKDEKGE